MPASARKYPAWWANTEGSHSYASAWLDCGWLTSDVDLASQRLTFRRILETDEVPGSALWNAPDEGSSTASPASPVSDPALPHDWAAESETRTGHLFVTWRTVGRAVIDAGERLLLPDVPAAPGLYRFHLRHGGAERRYVGESTNLKQRFGFYRNPGKSQQTNIRINNLLRTALNDGGEVSVDLATRLVFEREDAAVPLDLADKIVRRMFEHFAQVIDGCEGVDSLNR